MLRDQDSRQFKLVSEFQPAGRPAAGDRKAGKGLKAKRRQQVLLGRHRLGQDFYDGQRHRPGEQADPGDRAEQDAGGAAL